VPNHTKEVETMIDTLRLLTRAEPTQEQLLSYWRRQETNTPGGQTSLKYIYNRPKQHPHPLRATYRPLSLNGPRQLSLEFSLPKILIGKNWELVWDLPPTVQYLDAIFAACEAFPPLTSVAQMTVSRLDICYNHDVGQHLTDYIQAFSRLRHSRRDTVTFNAETAEFRDKSTKWKFYDKHAETKGEAPAGMLRQETTLTRAASVKRALGTKKPVLYGDLTLEKLKAVLDNNLDALGLAERCLMAPPHVSQMLTLSYGRTKGPHLFGIWTMAQTMSAAEIAEQLHITRNTVNRHLADIRKANVILAAPPTDEPLPPLTIAIPDPLPPLSAQICTQTPGVTPGSLDFGDEPQHLDDEDEEGDDDDDL
jgi:hypothetical protein